MQTIIINPPSNAGPNSAFVYPPTFYNNGPPKYPGPIYCPVVATKPRKPPKEVLRHKDQYLPFQGRVPFVPPQKLATTNIPSTNTSSTIPSTNTSFGTNKANVPYQNNQNNQNNQSNISNKTLKISAAQSREITNVESATALLQPLAETKQTKNKDWIDSKISGQKLWPIATSNTWIENLKLFNEELVPMGTSLPKEELSRVAPVEKKVETKSCLALREHFFTTYFSSSSANVHVVWDAIRNPTSPLSTFIFFRNNNSTLIVPTTTILLPMTLGERGLLVWSITGPGWFRDAQLDLFDPNPTNPNQAIAAESARLIQLYTARLIKLYAEVYKKTLAPPPQSLAFLDVPGQPCNVEIFSSAYILFRLLKATDQEARLEISKASKNSEWMHRYSTMVDIWETAEKSRELLLRIQPLLSSENDKKLCNLDWASVVNLVFQEKAQSKSKTTSTSTPDSQNTKHDQKQQNQNQTQNQGEQKKRVGTVTDTERKSESKSETSSLVFISHETDGKTLGVALQEVFHSPGIMWRLVPTTSITVLLVSLSDVTVGMIQQYWSNIVEVVETQQLAIAIDTCNLQKNDKSSSFGSNLPLTVLRLKKPTDLFSFLEQFELFEVAEQLQNVHSDLYMQWPNIETELSEWLSDNSTSPLAFSRSSLFIRRLLPRQRCLFLFGLEICQQFKILRTNTWEPETNAQHWLNVRGLSEVDLGQTPTTLSDLLFGFGGGLDLQSLSVDLLKQFLQFRDQEILFRVWFWFKLAPNCIPQRVLS